MSGYPTSMSLPRVDRLSTDPYVLGYHTSRSPLAMMAIHRTKSLQLHRDFLRGGLEVEGRERGLGIKLIFFKINFGSQSDSNMCRERKEGIKLIFFFKN